MSGSGKGAIVLAGGDSTRIGRPKTLLKLDGSTLIERVVGLLWPHFHRITVVTNYGYLFEHLPVIITRDMFSGRDKNPLQGIHAGLVASPLPYQFVVACDMPFLNLDLINHMGIYAPEYDVVVPRIGSYYQPLHAYYSRSCINIIEQQILNRDYKIINFYGRLKVKIIGLKEIAEFDPQLDSFFNINTWDDLKLAREKLTGYARNLAEDAKR